MDNMRRQRNTMDDRYARSQMMRNPQMDCDECGNARILDRRDDDRGRDRNQCDDDCSRSRDMLYGVPLAMGYVPWQNFECTYEPAQALQAGTIFPELDKPFYGRRGMR